MWLMVAGGFPMIVIVVVGLLALVAAARFAWSPAPGRLPYIGALALAVGSSAIAGVAVDLVAVSTKVPANPEWADSPDLPLIVLAGFGESLAPAILGAGIVAVTALLVATGLRRLPAG